MTKIQIIRQLTGNIPNRADSEKISNPRMDNIHLNNQLDIMPHWVFPSVSPLFMNIFLSE